MGGLGESVPLIRGHGNSVPRAWEGSKLVVEEVSERNSTSQRTVRMRQASHSMVAKQSLPPLTACQPAASNTCHLGLHSVSYLKLRACMQSACEEQPHCAAQSAMCCWHLEYRQAGRKAGRQAGGAVSASSADWHVTVPAATHMRYTMWASSQKAACNAYQSSSSQ